MTLAPLRVRVAAADDATSLLPLFEAFYGDHFHPKTAEAIRAHLTRAAAVDIVILAETGGSAVGFASLRLLPQIESDAPDAELSDIYVDPTRRRMGVGRALIAFAEDLARKGGAPRLRLTAATEDGAQAFYRALGFAAFAVAMERSLGGGP